jgi:hypothetical protein
MFEILRDKAQKPGYAKYDLLYRRKRPLKEEAN